MGSTHTEDSCPTASGTSFGWHMTAQQWSMSADASWLLGVILCLPRVSRYEGLIWTRWDDPCANFSRFFVDQNDHLRPHAKPGSWGFIFSDSEGRKNWHRGASGVPWLLGNYLMKMAWVEQASLRYKSNKCLPISRLSIRFHELIFA